MYYYNDKTLYAQVRVRGPEAAKNLIIVIKEHRRREVHFSIEIVYSPTRAYNYVILSPLIVDSPRFFFYTSFIHTRVNTHISACTHNNIIKAYYYTGTTHRNISIG